MKVLVAMSGGLKSLVTAWLLKKQGMQIRGVYLDLIGQENSQDKVETLERKLGISIQIIPAQSEFEVEWNAARQNAIALGEGFDSERFFHQSFLFPKLMELRDQYQFSKISTGHRALVQEDQVSKVYRVFQNADGNLKESLFLLGRRQADLASLLLPLGSIPSSMFLKLSKELDMGKSGESTSTWSNAYSLPRTDSKSNYEVISTSGTKLGTYASLERPEPGMLYIPPENPENRYRVVEISPEKSHLIVNFESNIEYKEVQFYDVNWFSREDLGLKPLTCGMMGPSNVKPVPIRLLQYEGGRIRGFLNHSFRGEEANIFRGQTVLWVEGTEILGGGRVLRTR